MPILGYDGCAEPTYASESAAAIITMVFQHTENGGEWCGSISVVFTIVWIDWLMSDRLLWSLDWLSEWVTDWFGRDIDWSIQ